MYQPNSRLTRIQDAAVEPLTLQMAKKFARVEISDDDDIITLFLKAARRKCEQIVDQSFITTTWQFIIDFLPLASNPYFGFAWPFNQYGSGGAYNRVSKNDGGITLPNPPLISLQTLEYIDFAGNTISVPVPPDGNLIVLPGTPGRVYPAYGAFFPMSQPRPAAVTFTYTAGYGPSPDDCPPEVATAIGFLTAHFYENRSSSVPIPEQVGDILSPIWGGNYS